MVDVFFSFFYLCARALVTRDSAPRRRNGRAFKKAGNPPTDYVSLYLLDLFLVLISLESYDVLLRGKKIIETCP